MVQGLLDINMPRSSLAATNIPLALNGGGGCGDFGSGLENTCASLLNKVVMCGELHIN